MGQNLMHESSFILPNAVLEIEDKYLFSLNRIFRFFSLYTCACVLHMAFLCKDAELLIKFTPSEDLGPFFSLLNI